MIIPYAGETIVALKTDTISADLFSPADIDAEYSETGPKFVRGSAIYEPCLLAGEVGSLFAIYFFNNEGVRAQEFNAFSSLPSFGLPSDPYITPFIAKGSFGVSTCGVTDAQHSGNSLKVTVTGCVYDDDLGEETTNENDFNFVTENLDIGYFGDAVGLNDINGAVYCSMDGSPLNVNPIFALRHLDTDENDLYNWCALFMGESRLPFSTWPSFIPGASYGLIAVLPYLVQNQGGALISEPFYVVSVSGENGFLTLDENEPFEELLFEDFPGGQPSLLDIRDTIFATPSQWYFQTAKDKLHWVAADLSEWGTYTVVADDGDAAAAAALADATEGYFAYSQTDGLIHFACGTW